ncbi:hypothetical protein M3Y94_00787000 [Aphelenchoides besseyi]|nr:hypothetical protein M3Y94_00787000 [Aphelenchoides besseyi]
MCNLDCTTHLFSHFQQSIREVERFETRVANRLSSTHSLLSSAQRSLSTRNVDCRSWKADGQQMEIVVFVRDRGEPTTFHCYRISRSSMKKQSKLESNVHKISRSCRSKNKPNCTNNKKKLVRNDDFALIVMHCTSITNTRIDQLNHLEVMRCTSKMRCRRSGRCTIAKSSTVFFAEAARKWNSMSENEKSRYYDEAQKLRDVHVKSLEEWKTKENLEAKKLFIANAKKTSTRRRRTIAASDANQKTGRKVGRPSGSRKTSK